MCNYCKPMIKCDKLLRCCVLNGLQTIPVPPKLEELNSLSSQLIQCAKCFQTVVQLGTYASSKVPVYSSLKVFKLTTFFLPWPLSKTACTLDLAKRLMVSSKPDLPDPELYIVVNGTPVKSNAIWRSLVDVNRVKWGPTQVERDQLALPRCTRQLCWWGFQEGDWSGEQHQHHHAGESYYKGNWCTPGVHDQELRQEASDAARHWAVQGQWT